MSMPNDEQPALRSDQLSAPSDRNVSPDLARHRKWALTALLILESLVLFAAVPLAALGIHGLLIGGGLLALLLIAATVVISPGAGAKILTLVAVLLAASGAAFRIAEPSPITIWLGYTAAIVALIAISIVIAGVVFGPGRVTHHRIQGAVVLYLNVAVIFMSMYRLVLAYVPTAFANVPPGQTETAAIAGMLYFSFTTLTSTGFGEILPIHPIARSLANLESIIGQLYLAILLARLVTLHLEGRRP